MKTMRRFTTDSILALAAVIIACGFANPLRAQPPDDVLTSAEWQRVDLSVERALLWLASRQQRDGSFQTLSQGQPGVTSLCVMAFVAHGHMPGEGPYGGQLQQALNFIVSCQRANGLLALVGPPGSEISRNISHERGSTSAYNHALSAILLSEVFAMGGGDLEKSQTAIEKALQATLEMQRWPKRRQEDKGGWRYVDPFAEEIFDADLSITGWQLMFLRSAKNAGFEVPKRSVDDAVAYVRRCFQPRLQTFTLFADPGDQRSRGMAGAGILALSHAGLHNSREARLAGDWLLKEGFENYNECRPYSNRGWVDDRYHYSVFCASQAMYQLGGDHWRQFYPAAVTVILDNQNKNGSWEVEAHHDAKFGNAYTTALMTLTLGASNQLLPIFQR